MQKFLLSCLVLIFAIGVSACTVPNMSEEDGDSTESRMSSPTTEPETTLVPVKEVDPSVNQTPTESLDSTIDETDSLIKDMQSDSFTDLPSDLGQ